MRMITIGRAFGRGGKEPGKRIADLSGFHSADSANHAPYRLNRMKTRKMTGGGKWGVPCSYGRTIHTAAWDVQSLAPAVAKFAIRRLGGNDAYTII